MALNLHCYDSLTHSVARVSLPMDGPGSAATVRLTPLPGASAIQLFLEGEGGLPAIRAECAATTSDPVAFTIAWGKDDVLSVSNPFRRVLTFPAQDRYKPAKINVIHRGPNLDVLILIDGTAHSFADEAKRRAWVENVVQFVHLLRADHQDLYSACMAFGDHSLGDFVNAQDLDPKYAIYPENPRQRQLEAWSDEQLRDRMLEIPPTSGGDLVDALAEALSEAAQAGWRSEARKLIFIVGESPGNSVLNPPPPGADAHARRYDVDSEAVALHDTYGIEIITVYSAEQPSSEAARALTEYARMQYERLASLRRLSFSAQSFTPERASTEFNAVSSLGAIARGPSYGVLAESGGDG